MEWVEALVAHALAQPKVWTALSNLMPVISVLSVPRLEALIMETLEKIPEPLSDEHPALLFLQTYTGKWSVTLSRAVIANLIKRQESGNNRSQWQLCQALSKFAHSIPPTLAAEIETNWPTETTGWSNWKGYIQEFLSILNQRFEIHQMIRLLEGS